MLMLALESAADAFLTVGAIVAVLFLATGLIRVRWGPNLEKALGRQGRGGPALAVLATLPPGCIGVLAISRLYVRGSVTFGTAIAALVSTMGDSAWWLIATDLKLTLILKGAFAILGAAVGFVVDAVGWAPDRQRVRATPAFAHAGSAGGGGAAVMELDDRGSSEGTSLEGCPTDSSCGPSAPEIHEPRPQAWPAYAFWAIVALGLMIALPIQLRLVDEDFLEGAQLILGVSGMAAAVAVMAQSRCRIGCGEDSNDVERDVSAVLLNGAQEAAFVTVWVAVAFGLWDITEASGWIPLESLPLAGAMGVVLGALAGLVPACGVELLVAGLFVAGGVPLPVLVSYLLSQDGNGFIPIAARRPRSAAWATVLTTVIAIAVGLALNALL